ncbi:phenylalanine--tRNA ligase subunit beta [Candidatus Marsarchaeota archaeon]|nr:phenylalanine--tRNA ligase subunit beta [Candidatus Marsarchaeota archaeon]MCL5404338.1 phenylalanine--tRNA ligase subunit beta [Candidatus Marsarchaeota archaeon]
MAIVTFDLRDLEAASGKLDLKEAIGAIGMEVEAVENGQISLDVTPNRPDLLDITGLSRQLGFYSGNLKQSEYRINGPSGISIKVDGSVKAVRPYIAGIVAKGLNLEAQRLRYLINFSEKLGETYGRRRKKLALGLHDLDRIAGQLSYAASEDGSIRPLNGSKEMSFSEVLSSHEKGIAYSDTIKVHGKGTMFPFLKDSRNTISLIPITNSEHTKVTTHTNNLFVDITGTDEAIISKVADILACKFIDMGAAVQSVKIIYGNKEIVYPGLYTKDIHITKSGFESVLGMRKQPIDMQKLCDLAGYMYKGHNKNSLSVTVPPYRADVINAQDVYEDLLFAFGYDNVLPLPVLDYHMGKQDKSAEFVNRLCALMIGLGYTEAYNNYLTNEQQQFGMLEWPFEPKSLVKIKYSKTENISIMRQSLLPMLMQNLLDSSANPMPYRLFEIGKVFRFREGAIQEETHIAFVSEHSKANFSEAKTISARILEFLGIECTIVEYKDPAFIDGRCARIITNDGNKAIGIIGEIHPRILLNFRLDEPVDACEISLNMQIK